MRRGAAVDGIREGAEEIEDCAPAELFTDRSDEAHAWVEGGGEEEGVVCGVVEGCEAGGGHGCEDRRLGMHRGEHVGGAGFGGCGAVAMFGDEQKGRGEDGGGGADVEGVVGVAACANDVALEWMVG